ncbi:hypothetical protein ACUXHF_001569 [Staphylococcus epidermidis]
MKNKGIQFISLDEYDNDYFLYLLSNAGGT